MTTTRRSVLRSGTATMLAILAAPHVARAQSRSFSFAYDQPRTTGYGIFADIFGNKLKELSKGTMTTDQFPGAQLGQEPQALQKVRSGDIDFNISSTANASTLAPESGVFSLHYLFTGEAHLTKAIADPGVVAAVRGMFKERVQGAQVLCVGTLGLRNIYAKKEIRRVEDMKGLKIRVQATKTEDTHFPAYGAQVVHMPFGDVYTSLQTGVVDAAENGINVYLSNKHYEVAPVMSWTQHEANNSVLWVSDKVWNSLNPEQQAWVQEAANTVGREQPARALKLEDESAVRLEKIGVKLVREVDKSGFIKTAAPIQDALAAELGPNAVKILGLARGLA